MANSLSYPLSEPSTIHFSPFTAALLPLFHTLALSLALSQRGKRTLRGIKRGEVKGRGFSRQAARNAKVKIGSIIG